MEWYYAENMEQRGPVSADEFEQLVRVGTVKADTLVWRAGMDRWQRYAEVVGPASEPEESGGASRPGGLVCSECGRTLSPEEVARYGSGWVCADCKPLVLQSLRDGRSGDAPRAEGASFGEVLGRDYSADVGGCLNRGWEMAISNFGLVIFGTLGLVALTLATSVVLMWVPVLNFFLGWAVTGLLWGGYWVFLLNLLRRDETSAANILSTIGPRVGSLLFAGLVTGMLEFLCLLPALGALLAILAVNGVISWSASPDLTQWGALAIGGVALVSLIGLGGWIYLSVSWLFVFPLVADRGLGCWSAMKLSRAVVGKHWWWTLLLAMLRLGLIGIGYLLCCGGVLFFLPVGYGLLAAHFLTVFGDLEEGAA